MSILEEALRRRTFAIISHPDAGKTTLTEKLLLYGNAILLAGAVKAKKSQRETASDWMELEKKRGISISSTVMQFDYANYRLNLLDTPGHKDFSEDTYRVLMAVDAVIMVIDAGKGIESQTLKLFEICSKRGIPIFTFMNKLDRPAKAPLDLIDQLEKVLKIHAYPVNWPLGNGTDFKGIYDRMKKEVFLFERSVGGAYRAPVSIHNLADPFVKEIMNKRDYLEVVEEVEMLDVAQGDFDINAVLQGKTTPVFFGSAANNFGVELLLNDFLKYSAEPAPRQSNKGIIPLDYKDFSAFVFKVQANMNPMHRDRIVFARVCSGEFSRDIKVYHHRSEKFISLADSYNLFGRDREFVESAYPGDIIGFVTKLDYRIGDTISTDKSLLFDEIPRFAPECFAYLHSTTPSTYKRFKKGLDQLLAENVVQAFYLDQFGNTSPLLGAVGPLQFEVLQYRIKEEYSAESRLEMTSFKRLKWIESSMTNEELKQKLPQGGALGKDDQDRRVVFFANDWSLQYFVEKNPTIKFFDTP